MCPLQTLRRQHPGLFLSVPVSVSDALTGTWNESMSPLNTITMGRTIPVVHEASLRKERDATRRRRIPTVG